MVIEPTGRFAYLASWGNDGGISGFSIDAATGALTSIGILSPDAVDSLTVDPTGKFVYAGGMGQVFAFAINAANGTLSPVAGSPFATGGSANFVAVDPSGRFVYSASRGDGVVRAYAINADTGAFTSYRGTSSLTRTDPRAIVVLGQ